MSRVRLLVAMLLTAIAATASGYSFQGLTYSNSGTVRTGAWTCRYALAKSLASSENIPLVVVWVSPTCTYCKNLASALGSSSAFKTWMARRNYVMVFAVGQTTSSTYGTAENDVFAAYSFAEVGISKFPFVGLWWKKGASGSEVKKRFSGRDGLMPSKSGSLAQQFMDSVDQYVGAYAGAGGVIAGDDPDIPAPAPGGKTYKVTFNANGGTSSVRSRTVSAGAKVGTLPTATRSGYRLGGWFTSAKGDEQITPSTVVTKSVTFYAHWEKVYSLSVSVSPSGGGKVDGAGSYAAGESVTLKATATGGYVFSGWYSGESRLSQEPSLVCEMGSSAQSFKAKFIKKADDSVTIGAFRTAGDYVTGADVEPIVLSATGGSLPTLAVSKLPSGLKFTAKAITGYAANTIFGTPTKSGSYSVQVSAKTLGGAKASAILPLVIRTADERIVRVECDPEMGKVSGGGVFADGKKAPVKATAASRHCFTGWSIGETLVSRLASYSCPVDGADVTLVAGFVSKEQDLASVSLAVGGIGQSTVQVQTNVVRCGVYTNWTVVAKALSGTTVTASGLPSGLKLVKTLLNKDLGEYAYEIAGVPTSVSIIDSKTKLPKPTVSTIKVTTLGKSSVSYKIAFIVEALPSWAYGTFSGFAAADEQGKGVGVATMTVSAAGKISGKFGLFGTNWTYSVTGYFVFADTKDPAKMKFGFEGVAKCSKLMRPFVVEVTPGACNCSFADGEGDDFAFTLHRTVWKDKPALPSPKMSKAEIEPPEGFSKLTVGVSASGKASFAGKLADGSSVSSSSTVFVDPDGVRKAYLVVPASRKSDGCLEAISLQ